MSQAALVAISLIHPLLVAAQQPDNGDPGVQAGGVGSMQTGSEEGASGADSGAFTLSKGALIAIIVVVVVVSLFGIISIVLYWLAKKRHWEVRQSLRRMSRRLTGRHAQEERTKRQNRRTGVRMASPPPSSRPRGTKKPNQESDLEKGMIQESEKTGNTTTITALSAEKKGGK